MKKRTGFMLSLIFLMLGIIIGFIFAPIKEGFSFGNNNGNNVYNYKDKPET